MNALMSRPKEEQTNGPTGMLSRFRNEVERVFDRFAHDPWSFPWTPRNGADWMPALDITERESEVTIRAEIPGVAAKDVDVSIAGNILTISGEKEVSSEEEVKSYFMTERRYGSFRRSIELPDGVDPEKITAHQDNGVLTVKIARLKSATPRHVPVKVTPESKD